VTRDITLSRRKALAALGTIGAATAGAGLGTSAYFSDRETFENNSLVAGELDVKAAYSAHYSDWSADEDGSTTETGDDDVSVRMYDGPAGTTGTVADLEAGETGLPTNDAWLVAVDDPGQFLANTRTGADGTAACDGGTDADDLERPVIDLEDVKPGDFGEVTIDFALCDNPGFVWLNGAVESASENGTTEPEADDDDEEAGVVELLDVVQAAVWVDDGNDYQNGSEDPVVVDSLRNVLDALPAAGRPSGADAGNDDAAGDAGLIGDVPAERGGGRGRNCFSAETAHSVAFAWWVPVDHGNEIQSDSATFSLGLYAEQCRHNEGAGGAGVTVPDADVWNADATTTGPTDPEAGDDNGPAYGASVGAGDGSVVGAPLEDHSVDAGSVYLGDREFVPGDGVPLVGGDESPDGYEFGASVAYDAVDVGEIEGGEAFVVGAPGADGGKGAAYLFVRPPEGDGAAGTWQLGAVIDGETLGGVDDDARLGSAVDVDQTVGGLLVGAPGDGGAGSAWLLGLSNEGGAPADGVDFVVDERFPLEVPDSGVGTATAFGASVLLELDVTSGGFALMIGAPGAAVGGTDGVGAVYDYFGPETPPWKYVPSDGDRGDRFGADVAVYTGIVTEGLVTPVVGAPGRDGGDGAVYVHERPLEGIGTAGVTTDGVSAARTAGRRIEETVSITADGGAFGTSVAAFRSVAEGARPGDGPVREPPADALQVGDGERLDGELPPRETPFVLDVIGGAPGDGAGTASQFRIPIVVDEAGPTLGSPPSLVGSFTPGSGAADFGASVAAYTESYVGGEEEGWPERYLLVGAPGSSGNEGAAYAFDFVSEGRIPAPGPSDGYLPR
jgi:predicted ribosomally synthesized peptide with SipW-like signal peptide